MRYFFAILTKYLIEISVDSTEIPAYNSIKAKGAFAIYTSQKEGKCLEYRNNKSENTEINEGLVRFDIIFYVRMKNGLSRLL